MRCRHSIFRFLHVVAVASILALSLLALPSAATAQTDPAFRLDLGVPNIGIGVATFDPELLIAAGAHVALAHLSGHGARVDFVYLSPDTGMLFGPHRAHGESWMVDGAYFYRVRVAGNDRLGLGLDLSAGLTVAEVHFRQATNGLCFGSCGTPDVVVERVADGAHLGPNVGAALDFRAYGFVLGIDVRYRALLGLEATAGDRIDQHAFSATASLGIGFW